MIYVTFGGIFMMVRNNTWAQAAAYCGPRSGPHLHMDSTRSRCTLGQEVAVWE